MSDQSMKMTFTPSWLQKRFLKITCILFTHTYTVIFSPAVSLLVFYIFIHADSMDEVRNIQQNANKAADTYEMCNHEIISSQVSTRARWHTRVNTGTLWSRVSAAPAVNYLCWGFPSSLERDSSSAPDPARWARTPITQTPVTLRCRLDQFSIDHVGQLRNTNSAVLHFSQ